MALYHMLSRDILASSFDAYLYKFNELCICKREPHDIYDFGKCVTLEKYKIVFS